MNTILTDQYNERRIGHTMVKRYGQQPDHTHGKGKTYEGGKTSAGLKSAGKIKASTKEHEDHKKGK